MAQTPEWAPASLAVGCFTLAEPRWAGYVLIRGANQVTRQSLRNSDQLITPIA